MPRPPKRPLKSRPKKKAASGKKRPGRPREDGIRVRWTGFRPMTDAWGRTLPRFYKLDSLASAVDGMIRRQDKFIVPAVKRVMGPSAITQMHFDLVQEGNHEFVFRLKANNEKRKETTFAFVAAKREDDMSKLVRTRHQNLRKLHERAPKHVITPYDGGLIFMPRYKSKLKDKGGRHVYAYLTEWYGQYQELVVNRKRQFCAGGKTTPKAFSNEQSEMIRGSILEIIARTYDEAKHDCADVPQVGLGDIVVTKPKPGARPNVKLVACRRILTNAKPSKILHRFLASQWDWGGQPLTLAPSAPETVYDALSNALGKRQARLWINDYVHDVAKGKFADPKTFPATALKDLLY